MSDLPGVLSPLRPPRGRAPQLTTLYTVDELPFVEFKFDATMSFTDSNRAKVTRHPVETGAKVADHVYEEPRTITLEAAWSNTPLRAFVGASTGGVGVDVERRAEQLYNAFLELVRKHRLVSVEHPLLTPRTLKSREVATRFDLSGSLFGSSFVITSVDAPRTAQRSGDAVIVSVSLEEVVFVTSKVSDLPKTRRTTAANQKDAGKQDTQTPTPAQATKAENQTGLLDAVEAATETDL